MDEVTKTSAHKKPVALFDFDFTILEGDVGNAITFHLIANGLVRQPLNKDWRRTSKYMTAAGAAALTAACGTDVPVGATLPTKTNLACADEMVSMFVDNKTRKGESAFAGHDRHRMEPTYAWTAQLAAGYTPAEVSAMTLDLAKKMMAAPRGTKQVVGTRSLDGWLRFYDQSVDLIRALQTRGFDVRIITASPNPVVTAIAPMVGIAPENVIGIRQLLDAQGRLTYNFEGCGPVADGDNSMITYVEGKRCWVNKIVYGDTSKRAIERRPAENRQEFAVGDSGGDVAFLRDAKYKVVRENHKAKELMCLAYHNEAASWLVDPLSADVKPLPVALACSTTACKDSAGKEQPCRDEAGNAIPDQKR